MVIIAGASAPQHRVRPGIDVLLADSAHLIAGKRLGLITNQTGLDASGVLTIDRLYAVAYSRLLALFAPEHGIRGTARPGEPVNDTVDAATGLPIYSLYGANRAPTPEQLASLDLLLVDLQDVGARPYTYISTVILAMRAARDAGRRIIVLDRPNPIGCRVQGPLLDTTYASFLGMLPIPLRHGLTIGEMARFANAELRIGADLVVVPVQGWRRCDWFDATGLPWVNPSPNLEDLDALAWYPGTVLLEATNLSVGRGTPAAFRQVGAPWLDPSPVVRALRAAGVPVDTVTFTPRNPGDGKYDGIPVHGVRLGRRLDRRRGDPVRATLLLLRVIESRDPGRLRVDARGFALRYGVPRATTQDPAALRRFQTRIRPFLLYR